MSLLFGCYSWIKQEFEADFDNIEHVSIMNDNWDFGYYWGIISAQRGIGTSGPHHSLISDVVPKCDVYVLI